LHKANIVHKNLRHSCVYIDSVGVVRVGDYTLESRILEVLSIKGLRFYFFICSLYDKHICSYFADERPTMTMYPSAPGRGGKRGDIHRAGILMWTLFQVLKSYSILAVRTREFLFLLGKCGSSMGQFKTSDGNADSITGFHSQMYRLRFGWK
jgi:hypothetical protein